MHTYSLVCMWLANSEVSEATCLPSHAVNLGILATTR